MNLKDVLSAHDIPILIAKAYDGTTHQGEHHYGVLESLAKQVESTLNSMGSFYRDCSFDDDRDTSVRSLTSELSGLLETVPVTVESLTITPLIDAVTGKVDNGIMVISARIGDTEFKIAQKVMSAFESWAVYLKKRSTLFMTHNYRANIPLSTIPDIDGKSVGFNAIDGNFSATRHITEVKSIGAIKRAPFNKLVTGSLQSKPMTVAEKLYCLMDLAVITNTESLAWDVLETGLCDEKTIKMALKNAFQFESPNLIFSLIKTNHPALLPEMYEYGYLDLRRFDRYFNSIPSFSEKLVGLKTYLTPEAVMQSGRVLDKAQQVYSFDESVRAEFLTNILKAAPNSKRNTVKI